ncbi:molybdenum cofactor guanylyltransferase [Parapedobacter pyrenivorans]|uniref:Molybdenum cofactor guanylyltransferase n=1 Tax=Parapedobacter pyrenivorans TaxID=1305674 RepID=A0A917HDD4_9SPHI|nr:molybdenum cofactor guanylyltransferase [Parapedobacter pyrenivorans]GGG74945.1 molybdenum cofactor guanylyltransferase [Parapedobacter pyrenivorans]
MDDTAMEMVGVVLCGGRSVRMGTDKGLLPIGDKTWAQHVYERLGVVVPSVVLSVNAQQADSYRAVLPYAECVVDNDQLPIGGPLHGLLSVHLRHPSANLLVLACDMVAMQEILLQYLVKCFVDKPCPALVYEYDGYPQPLCGLYSRLALATVTGWAVTEGLANHSMMHMLDLVEATRLPHGTDYDDCFSNYNHPDNL